jgi:hypothetical protein
MTKYKHAISVELLIKSLVFLMKVRSSKFVIIYSVECI